MTTGSNFLTEIYFLPLSNCRQREDSRQILLSWTLPGQLAHTLVNLNLASQTIYSKLKLNPKFIRGPTSCWFIAYYYTAKLINVEMLVWMLNIFFSSYLQNLFKYLMLFKISNKKIIKNGPVHLTNETPFYLQNPVRFQLEPGF